MKQVRVTVAVLTFHRPEQIRETVAQLHAQTSIVKAPYRAEVLVVDNDPAASGRGAVLDPQLADVRYVVEPTPGIAAARNRALDEASHAGSDVLLFIDDDGRPGEGWLEVMLDSWSKTRPAMVEGWVSPKFLAPVDDPWIDAGRFFIRRRLADGASLSAAACGNLLIDLAQLGEMRFTRELGRSGGEDTLLTRQLRAKGGRIIFCHDSVVVDIVDPARVNRTWVLLRSLSHGNTDGVVSILLSGSDRKRVSVGIGGLGRMVFGAGRWARGMARHDLEDQARGARVVARGAGMVLAAAGLSYREYAPGTPLYRRFAPTPAALKPGRR